MSLIGRIYDPSWQLHCLRSLLGATWRQQQLLAVSPPAVTGGVEAVIRFGSAYLLNLPAAIEGEGLGCVTIAEAVGLVTVGRDAVKPWEQQLGKVGVTVEKGGTAVVGFQGVMEEEEEEEEGEEGERKEDTGEGEEGGDDERGEEREEGDLAEEGEEDEVDTHIQPGEAQGMSQQHRGEGTSNPSHPSHPSYPGLETKKKKKMRVNVKKAALTFFSYVSGNTATWWWAFQK